MAVIAKKNDGKRTRKLTAALRDTILQSEPSLSEPFVIEDQIAQTKSAHVMVIWDKWAHLTPDDRSKTILDAYAEAGRLADAAITMAMGLTGEEAFRMGFLQYGIVTTRRKGDEVSINELSKAMASAGGVFLRVGSSTQLRFPTLELAEDAYRRLSQEVPGPYWAIMHDQSTPE